MCRRDNVICRVVDLIKRRGLSGAIDKVLTKIHLKKVRNDLAIDLGFVMDTKEIPLNTKEQKKHKNDTIKLLNWVIPEMGKGSGGHINIFRFISYLENMGFHSRVYLYMSPNYKDNAAVRTFTKENFRILDDKVELFYDVSQMTFAHAVIATSWQTAYYVRRNKNTFVRCYFVQDFEPYFFPMGSYYQFAENTYKFGLKGITAGDWLKEKLQNEYGMDTASFGFSYDKEIYTLQKKKDKKKRIFFYARPYTARRDFEIGLLALDKVSKKIPNVEVVFAGEDISRYVISFKHKNLGIVAIEKLSTIYAQCDLCLILSNTNLSLLPLEVMASNSVAVCSKGENSTWLINSENAILVGYEPHEIADELVYYLNNPRKLENIRKKGVAFARATSWTIEAEKVKKALDLWIKDGIENIE